jgi:hypothetical protein
MTTPLSKTPHTESLGSKINKSLASYNDNSSNTEKFIDKISSEQALNRILDKYRNIY